MCMNDDFHIDGEGIVRWISNGNIPFDDILEKFQYEGRISAFNLEISSLTRANETASFLMSYREQMKNHVPDEEEMYEMRSAFGEGTTVVNVITGNKVTL